jgi:hypothetical protein
MRRFQKNTLGKPSCPARRVSTYPCRGVVGEVVNTVVTVAIDTWHRACRSLLDHDRVVSRPGSGHL